MADELNEITFCDECPYSGEPNGCNRKEGECRAHDYCFDLRDERDALKSENAALRERLEKAVDLKARVGDIVYIPWINDGKDAIAELPINKISVHKDNFVLYWVDLSKCDKDYMWVAPKLNYTHSDLGSVVFLTREAAEARLAELKGGAK